MVWSFEIVKWSVSQFQISQRNCFAEMRGDYEYAGSEVLRYKIVCERPTEFSCCFRQSLRPLQRLSPLGPIMPVRAIPAPRPLATKACSICSFVPSVNEVTISRLNC